MKKIIAVMIAVITLITSLQVFNISASAKVVIDAGTGAGGSPAIGYVYGKAFELILDKLEPNTSPSFISSTTDVFPFTSVFMI